MAYLKSFDEFARAYSVCFPCAFGFLDKAVLLYLTRYISLPAYFLLGNIIYAI